MQKMVVKSGGITLEVEPTFNTLNVPDNLYTSRIRGIVAGNDGCTINLRFRQTSGPNIRHGGITYSYVLADVELYKCSDGSFARSLAVHSHVTRRDDSGGEPTRSAASRIHGMISEAAEYLLKDRMPEVFHSAIQNEREAAKSRINRLMATVSELEFALELLA